MYCTARGMVKVSKQSPSATHIKNSKVNLSLGLEKHIKQHLHHHKLFRRIETPLLSSKHKLQHIQLSETELQTGLCPKVNSPWKFKGSGIISPCVLKHYRQNTIANLWYINHGFSSHGYYNKIMVNFHKNICSQHWASQYLNSCIKWHFLCFFVVD